MRAVNVWNPHRHLALFLFCTATVAVPVWNTPARDEMFDHDLPLTAMSEGGNVIVAVDRGSTKLRCLDTTGKRKPFEAVYGLRKPASLAITPDGKVAAVGDAFCAVVVRLAPKHSIELDYPLKVKCRAITISADGKRVAIASKTDVILVDVPSGEAIRTLSKDGKARAEEPEWNQTYRPTLLRKIYVETALVASCGHVSSYVPPQITGDEVNVAAKAARVDEPRGEYVTALRFSPDGKALIAGSREGTYRLWSVGSGKLLWKASNGKGIFSSIRTIAYFADGKRIAAGSDDTTVRILEAKTGKTLASYQTARGTINHVAVSPDGKYIASSAWDKRIHVWDVEKKRVYFHSEKIEFQFAQVTFDGDAVVTAEGPLRKALDLKTKKMTDLPSPK